MEELTLNLIKKVVEDKKCEDITVYDVRTSSPICSYIVIATVNNARQGKAVADQIEEEVEKLGGHIHHVEGDERTPWILIDEGDIIIHLFTEQERQRINLDELITQVNNHARI